MNPALKKKLIERGLQNTKPSSWQGNGGPAEKCPNCGSSLFFHQPGWETITYKCVACNKLFERDGWITFKEVIVK